MSVYRAAPELNRLGPPVPVWFKRALKKIDKDLVIQYRPPRDETHPRGVNPQQFPGGVLEICKKLGRSGLLHPYVVWALHDTMGNPATPGPDSIRLIRRAYDLNRSGNMNKMEKELDKYYVQAKRDAATKSKNQLMKSMQEFCSVLMNNQRQWNHKVYLRREIPKGE